MALIKCLGCGANISDKAIVCPKCGRKNIKDNESNKTSFQKKPISNSEVKSFNLKFFIGAIFISLISVFLLAYLFEDDLVEEPLTEEQEEELYREHKIRRKLCKNPSSGSSESLTSNECVYYENLRKEMSEKDMKLPPY